MWVGFVQLRWTPKESSSAHVNATLVSINGREFHEELSGYCQEGPYSVELICKGNVFIDSKADTFALMTTDQSIYMQQEMHFSIILIVFKYYEYLIKLLFY